MTAVASPLNTNNERIDSAVLSTGPTGLLKRGVAGSSRTVTGGDVNAVAQETGTHVDDAAFTIATDTVSVAGALADETSPDSVNEGDAGALRMTLDRYLRVVSVHRAGTGAKTNVSDTASSTTILASNALRTGATIWNDSTAVLYLDLTGGTASATSCTVKLIADAYYEVPFGYTGAITGIWASDASGAARITEWTGS